MKKIIYAIGVVLLTGACASVPMAPAGDDLAAKEFKVPAGKSRIYIYRNENLGGAIKVTVTVDGKLVGQSAPMTYFVIDAAPGTHRIACQAESNSEITLKTKAGEAAFVWQEMKMGMWTASCKMNEIAPEKGEAAVRTCKRAISSF